MLYIVVEILETADVISVNNKEKLFEKDFKTKLCNSKSI